MMATMTMIMMTMMTAATTVVIWEERLLWEGQLWDKWMTSSEGNGGLVEEGGNHHFGMCCPMLMGAGIACDEQG
jgi:hypothetical protein